MIFFKKKEDKKGPEHSHEQTLDELGKLRSEIGEKNLPEYVKKVALKELDRIKYISESSAEYTIGINYIDYLLSLPWNTMTKDNLDINRAAEILDEQHYGLQDIKDRILEHIAVRILKNKKNFKILVVDDEKLTCMNIKHVLEKQKYEVYSALSGEEAISLLSHHNFDVIITDLKMQDIDGLSVLEQAKKNHPSTEVIIITGYATVNAAVEAMKKGSFQFLSKPLKLEEIISTVENALENHRILFENKGPILCFVGPPGTGKTSLGSSIAKSMGRKFIRISLAGVKDEAQIRGHRRSYVGALPGRIIQEIRRAGSKNPVFMLDEIDKIGQDFKGDPSAPLLEILDPEQNKNYVDHYLDIPFDLSKVMFIATANTIDNIPGPLLDRLEIISVPGYLEEEKVEIAKKYLIPKEIVENGLQDYDIEFKEDAIKKIIKEYTKEAGLRNLQRQISSICRKTARNILEREISLKSHLTIDVKKVEKFLGPPKFRPTILDVKDRVGVATALAWTPFGGEILFIEATKMAGSDNLILTGSLGNVLKESAQAALSFIKSNIHLFKISADFFKSHDIHIHVPAGAIPKDGPSAGLPIFAALISLITNKKCRRDVALSGEITLSGRVLPVGGIREKLLAAKIAGVKTVILPEKNKTDFSLIPNSITSGIDIIFIRELSEILDNIFSN